jgi:ATP/maltotriose-dependent transcriptional regulator MalT
MAEEQNDYESQTNSGYFLETALYTHNKISEALIVLERAYSVRFHTLGINHFNIACALCYCYLVNHEYEKASKIIEESGEYTVSTNNPYMILLKEIMEAEVNWRSESEGKAFNWINKNVDIPFFPFTNFFVPHLTQIKLLVYKNDTESLSKAEALLEKVGQLLISTHNQLFKIHVLALQSILYFELGREEEALDKLKDSMEIAEAGDVIRVYLDIGPKMANLLNKLSKREKSVRFIAKILTAFKEKEINKMSASDNKSGSDEVRKLDSIPGDNLTEREYEILTLMAHHLQNKEIAEKLFISAETVKKHTSRIYQKLNVGRRRKAVEKARALGLI